MRGAGFPCPSRLYHKPTHVKPDTAYLVARALVAWMPRTGGGEKADAACHVARPRRRGDRVVRDVRYWHKADIDARMSAFGGKADIGRTVAYAWALRSTWRSARFSEPEASLHSRSLVGSITIMYGFSFWVHTGGHCPGTMSIFLGLIPNGFSSHSQLRASRLPTLMSASTSLVHRPRLLIFLGRNSSSKVLLYSSNRRGRSALLRILSIDLVLFWTIRGLRLMQRSP